jgi:Phage major capsid protein E
MPMGDIWDQNVLTEVVRRNIETEANRNLPDEDRSYFGARIAPLTPVQARVMRIRVSDVLPYSMGQFKAPDATPPLVKFKPTLREQLIELVLLEEMERFTGTEWQDLNSNDDRVARGAMLSLVDRLSIMQARNDRLTEWMRWQAFKNHLIISYPDGGSISIDYGIPPNHFPTAATPWTNTVTADPVEDLYTWSAIGADEAGAYYSIVHLNNQTWRLIVRNENIRDYLSALGRSIMLPTRADLQQLMREGTSNFEIIDAGYLSDNATTRQLNKFLPDNRVLLTTTYTLNGTRIADVPDGQVLVRGGDNSPPDIAQGMQSEIMTNPFSKNVFRRQASARIVRIRVPEAFLYATVGA